MEKEKTNRIAYVVFIPALVIVVFNVVSLVFPALIVALAAGTDVPIDPFELGAFAIPVIGVNLFVLGFGILYYTKHLPNTILNSIKFIRNFEVSPQVATTVIVILLVGYVVYAAQDLSNYEGDQWPDFGHIKAHLKDFPAQDTKRLQPLFYVKYFLLLSSQIIFQNIKVIPFIGSISLLLLTYFFTVEISKKRFAGLVAIVVLLQSYIFQLYDTMATYSSFWILFYLLSLYLIHKKWYLSPLTYILSIFSKALTFAYLPLTLFFVYRSRMHSKNKIYITISYVIIGMTIIGFIVTADFFHRATWNSYEFWTSFTTLGFQLRSDFLILAFLLPLTVALFLVSRKDVPEADSILVLITGILIAGPMLVAVAGGNMQPYRFLPLIVFFAVGVGTLLSKKIIRQV